MNTRITSETKIPDFTTVKRADDIGTIISTYMWAKEPENRFLSQKMTTKTFSIYEE